MIITPHIYIPTPLPSKPRTPVIHLSELIRSTRHALKGDRPHFSALSISEKERMDVLVEGGFTWEDALESEFKRRMGKRYGIDMIPQLEIEKDGIYMTLDWVNLKKKVVIESKFTSMTMKKMDTDEREVHYASWWSQIKGYLHGMGWSKAELFVYWTRGDYSWGGENSGAQARRYELEFTKRELVENWSVLRRRADTIMKEMKNA